MHSLTKFAETMSMPMTAEAFESARLVYRDVAQANFEAWRDLDRAFRDALTLNQLRKVQVLKMYAAQYSYIKTISKSRKLANLAWLCSQALAVWQISKAEYAEHLRHDPNPESTNA